MTIKEIREWYGSKPEGKHYQKFLEKELIITLEALNRANRALGVPEKSLKEALIEDNQRMKRELVERRNEVAFLEGVIEGIGGVRYDKEKKVVIYFGDSCLR